MKKELKENRFNRAFCFRHFEQYCWKKKTGTKIEESCNCEWPDCEETCVGEKNPGFPLQPWLRAWYGLRTKGMLLQGAFALRARACVVSYLWFFVCSL
jgi:hypothetical protein